MNVFWTRGYRREDKTLSMGLVVVRPTYVAFLPLGFGMGPSDQLALGASMARGGAAPSMNVQWQGRYPINAWYQHGEQVLDSEVHRALAHFSSSGLECAARMTNAEAGFAARKYQRGFIPFAPGAPMILLDQAPPPVLMLSWRPAVYPFDKARALKITSIASVIFMTLGVAFMLTIWFQGDGVNPVPVIFFGIVTAIIWGAYVKNARDHAREVAVVAQANATANVGPYRG